MILLSSPSPIKIAVLYILDDTSMLTPFNVTVAPPLITILSVVVGVGVEIV